HFERKGRIYFKFKIGPSRKNVTEYGTICAKEESIVHSILTSEDFFELWPDHGQVGRHGFHMFAPWSATVANCEECVPNTDTTTATDTTKDRICRTRIKRRTVLQIRGHHMRLH